MRSQTSVRQEGAGEVEPEVGPHGNVVCLHHSGICQSIKALREATDVARREMDRRLEGMNEFRAQLERQAGMFVIRGEMEAMVDKLGLRIDVISEVLHTIKTDLSKLHGAKQWSDYIVTVILATVASLAVYFVTK